MKKSILSVALMLMIGLSSTFANNAAGVNQKVINSFNKEFANAKDVKWESGKEYVKATFSFNGQIMFAYYSETGEMLAMTRNILSSQLPINLQSGLKKDYSNFWISDLFEMASGNETAYYVTLESADSIIVLKSNDGSNWDQFKKEKKQAE
ncbi:MAG: hypothetical protein H7Y31_03690 [Chitinophagaceae bacterium]|nr:hypothetical protein [Chitinophagaceae bacterium]